MATVAQRSFAGGELAPALRPRADLVKYATGAARIRNFYVMRTGGAQSRAGTQFVAEVKDSTKPVRLLPFIFNNSQTYAIEFGHNYFRFHRLGEQLTDINLVISAIQNANPAVVSYLGVDPSNGQEVFISGVTGPLGQYVNERNFKIANVNTGTKTFQLQLMDGTNFDATALPAYVSGGTAARVYEVSSTYDQTELFLVRYAQSADVLSFAHVNHAVAELVRSGDTSWVLQNINFGASLSAPTGGSQSTTGGSAGAVTFAISAINQNLEESPISATITTANSGTGCTYFITWNPVAGAGAYYVYWNPTASGVANGWIQAGISFLNTWKMLNDDIANGGQGSIQKVPINSGAGTDNTSLFANAGNFPGAIANFQQRLMLANTNNNPETVWGSRLGGIARVGGVGKVNFNTSYPFLDSDAFAFSISGSQVNRIMHLLNLGRLVVFTSAGEHVADGGFGGQISATNTSATGLTPAQVNLRQHSYNGCSDVPPLIVNNSAIYVQANGNIVRDILWNFQVDGFDGNDLTTFATHLFDGYTIVDWAYQKTPYGVVWAVRSDGTLLSMTYLPRQQILAWTTHDTDGGIVESVCAVPENNESVIYMVVRRTVNGESKRYIERMDTRNFADLTTLTDGTFSDASVSFDGRNTVFSITMTMSGGTTWEYTEQLTLTASSSSFGLYNAGFSVNEIGNEVWLTGSDGSVIRFRITGYTSPTVVTGYPHKTVPTTLQVVATGTWSRAVGTISGLWHLEGQPVSVLGDGRVLASPNNAAYPVLTVTNGAITLPRCHAVVSVGLPFTCDLETLDIETPQDGSTIATKQKQITNVLVHLEKTRGLWAGGAAPTDDTVDPLEGLTEIPGRSNDVAESYDSAPSLITDKRQINILAQWNSNGRVFIRQVDPLPATILAVALSGWIPQVGR